MEGGELAKVVLLDQPMDCCFHPSASLLAGAVITGQVQVFRYEGETTASAFTLPAHEDSCRAVRFTPEGDLLLSASSDCSILATDITSGKPIARLEQAHPDAINRLECVEASTLISGDDEGLIKLWDLRQQKAICTLEAHEDFVSDLCFVPERGSLLSVSGDGTLAVTDLRTRKVTARSEDDADDELLSVVMLKNGKKAIAGSQEGVLFLYSWGYFNDCSDRFPGHPNSIDTIVKFDEDTIITGSSDGLIRILNVLPNKMLGVVGEHDEYPIECLALSGNKQLLASASHDNTIKLWDIKYLHEEDSGGEEEEEAMVEDTKAPEAGPASVTTAGDAAPASASDASDDSDMSDLDEEHERKSRQKREKTKMKGKGKGKATPVGGNFFADLI